MHFSHIDNKNRLGVLLMPIYEYECRGCHHKFDLLQKMSDKPAKTCPNCTEDKAERLVSAAQFQLKGTGWYATDFKDKGTAPKSSTSDTTKKGDSE
jgi:putative FmdB family regulatory protein